jgi:hypothetical protein
VARFYRDTGAARKPICSAILGFNDMKNLLSITVFLLAFITAGLAQTSATAGPELSRDITGLYSFVHEGEFVQIEVNEGKVTGLVSRFKNDDPEKTEFVDQSFEQAKLEGATLSFRTRPADGAWFEFSGTVERGPAKTPADEGYWKVKGTLIEHHTSANGQGTEKKHELTLSSFPAEREPDPSRTTDKEK